MYCRGRHCSDGRGQSCSLLLFKLLLVTSWTVSLVRAQKWCVSDHDCDETQHCVKGKLPTDQSTCTDCISCENQFNRAKGLIICPVQPLLDCGACLPGFNYSVTKKWFDQKDTATVEQSPKCEKIISDLLLMDAADSEEPEMTIDTGTYVGFAVLGLVVGATIGAVGTICYFRCTTSKSKNKNETTNEDEEKATEMHELSPKAYPNLTDEKNLTHVHDNNGSKYNGDGKRTDDHGHNGV